MSPEEGLAQVDRIIAAVVLDAEIRGVPLVRHREQRLDAILAELRA